MSEKAAMARAAWGHLAYTSFFERVLPTAVNMSIPYGALVAMIGAAASRTLFLPESPDPEAELQLKDAHHVGVVNVDGAFAINITTVDGKLINEAGTITIPAGEPGAFAICFWSQQLGAWVALTGCCAGGGGIG
jgi:hypothetical protein